MKKMLLMMAIIFASIINAQEIPTGKWFVVKNAKAELDGKNCGCWNLENGSMAPTMRKYNQRTLKGKKILIPLLTKETEFPCSDEAMLFKFDKKYDKYFITVKAGESKLSVQMNNQTNRYHGNQDKKITTDVKVGTKEKNYSYMSHYELMDVIYKGEGMWSFKYKSAEHKRDHYLVPFMDKIEGKAEIVGFVDKQQPVSWWVLINPETGEKVIPQFNELGANE